MKISKQARRDAKALFQAAMVDGVLDENRVRRVVDEVLSAKPRGYGAILSHFQRLLKLEQVRRTARIESATPLDAEAQARLKMNLELKYGKGLNFQFSENANLIGGTRVQVGSDVYDGSVRARLTELDESFKAA